MVDRTQIVSVPPFQPDYRASGVLFHITSLPSPCGIGDMGPAALAIAPLQDLRNFGSERRMNTPGSAQAEWSWRVTEELLDDSVFERLQKLTANTNRMPHIFSRPNARKAAS